MSMWDYQRQEPPSQRPYLFYAAFTDQSVVNQLEETHVIHPLLEIAALPAAHFRSSQAWDKLKVEQPGLASEVEACPLAVVLHGEVLQPASLAYLRDTLAVLEALLGLGAVATYDPLTLTWCGAAHWNETIDTKDFRPLQHVQVLGQGPGGSLRTRGLRKFGSPDLYLHRVPPNFDSNIRERLEAEVRRLCLGTALDPATDPLDGWRRGPVQGDLEDATFRNRHIELLAPLD